MPSLHNFMRYVDACHGWRTIADLALEMQLGEDAVTKMCRRLSRHNVLQYRKTLIKEGSSRYEYIATREAQLLFDAIVDGRVPVDVPDGELRAHLERGQEVGEDLPDVVEPDVAGAGERGDDVGGGVPAELEP